MKRLAVITALVLAFALPSRAQLTLRDALGVLDRESAVECSYSLVSRGDFPMKTNGTAEILGSCYHLVHDGLEDWCDGTTLWTVDASAKEVLVSPAGPSILSRIEEEIESIKSLNYDGKNLSCNLSNPAKGIDIDFKATGIRTSPAKREHFVFNTSALDRSWIVTDLR